MTDGMRQLIRAPRLHAVLASMAALGLFAGGLILLFGGQGWHAGAPPMPPESVRLANLPAPQPISATSGKTARPLPAIGRSIPISLDIPAIGVHTALITLGLRPDGTIAVPPLGKDAPAGWYRYLSSPGEPGPAVILGHVDSARSGPAVFYRLGELKPGERFTITRADGRRVTFTISRIGVYQKTQFPSEAVYGAVRGAEVRLVTCGGPFDRAMHHYRDNIVVFAKLSAVSPA